MQEFFDSLKSIADVNALIVDHHHESETVEYKTASVPFSNKEKDEIAKDVSAMANSGGGTIIYGVATESSVKTSPARIESIDVKNIETFSRVVNSNIQPRIEGIRLRALPPDSPQVLVVYVPQSRHSPHQSSVDKKYYHRSGIESIPMGHDLVELHFGRRLGPILKLVHKALTPVEFSEGEAVSKEIKIRLSLFNAGQRIGRYVHVILTFPSKTHVLGLATGLGTWADIAELYDGDKQVRQFTESSGVFHPGIDKVILEARFSVTREFWETLATHEPIIHATIVADRMEPQQALFILRGPSTDRETHLPA
jgi:hypothetical protein